MAEYRFFTSNNPYWSRQKQGGGTARRKRYGWCAAASAIWCANILIKNKKPGDSDPDKALAGILQVKYRWDPAASGQDTINLLAGVDLHGELHKDIYLNGVLEYMAAHTGVYHFSNAGHAMAADTRSGNLYWYDIENGLYAYANLDEWKQGIRTRYEADGDSRGRVWTVVLCSN